MSFMWDLISSCEDKMTVTLLLLSSPPPPRFYTAPPDPVPWLVWGVLHKICPFIPAPALLKGRRGDCAISLQILSRKWERLCSTIKPERAARSGAQQCVCFPSGWVQQSMLQSSTEGAHSALIKADGPGCKIMLVLNSAKSPQIATGQKTTSAILWNKIQI